MKPLPMPKRRVTEAVIEAYLRQRIKALSGECYKWSSPNVRGVPDRICVFPDGRVYFVEVKAPDGKLTTLQNKFIARMLTLNFKRCRVVWNKEDIDRWLREIGYG